MGPDHHGRQQQQGARLGADEEELMIVVERGDSNGPQASAGESDMYRRSCVGGPRGVSAAGANNNDRDASNDDHQEWDRDGPDSRWDVRDGQWQGHAR